MRAPKTRSEKESVLSWFFLDAAAILEGANVAPRDCQTTPQVIAEVSAGGATGRRRDLLLAGGLRVREPSPDALRRVQAAADGAGSASRLSEADRSILALALGERGRGVLLSDDYTVLDLAQRLGIRARPVATVGTDARIDWTARCVGCGRRYAHKRAGESCPVCGSEIRLKPLRKTRATGARGNG